VVAHTYFEYFNMSFRASGTWNGYLVADFRDGTEYGPQIVVDPDTQMPYAAVVRGTTLYVAQQPRIVVRVWDDDAEAYIPPSEVEDAWAVLDQVGTFHYADRRLDNENLPYPEMHITPIPAGTFYVDASVDGYKGGGVATVTLDGMNSVVATVHKTPEDNNGCSTRPSRKATAPGVGEWGKAFLPLALGIALFFGRLLAARRARDS